MWPKIGNRVPAGNGWTIQRIKLSSVNEEGSVPDYHLDRGYFKVRNPFGVVVDRALTAETARRRVKQHQLQQRLEGL